MKPAPFEYHAPTTVDEAVALLAELGDEAKVLAGGQSLVPMLALRLARFEHLVDIGRIAELRGRRARTTARCRSARRPATPRRARRRGRRRGAAARHGHAVHRPLPDPQPRHGRRLARPRRSRPPSTRRSPLALDAEFEVASVARRAHGRRPPTSSTGVWSTALEPDELLDRRSASRCGTAAAASASTSSPAATATSPSPARSRPSSSTPTTRSPAPRIALFGVGGDAGAGRAPPRRR